jgi:hypothetical protein
MSATLVRPAPVAVATSALWTGRVLSALGVLFLVFDTAIKLVGARAAVEGTVQLGFAQHQVLTIGLIELACLVLYLVPRTAVLGAVLFTGYFGGAIATHLRLGNPLFSHVLFPTYVAALLWVGLSLRDPRVRGMLGAR